MPNPIPRRHAGLPHLSLLAAGLLIACQAHAQDATVAQQQAQGAETTTQSDDATALDAILVTAQRAGRVSNGATNLDLAIKDTPQSISVVSDGQMRDFGATSVNDALQLATGLNVEDAETNRTYYMARGFDILSTQIDGVGMPNNWGVVVGAIDSFAYDKVEVIRGANGLLTGVGNASGTINYVRKRPTNDEQGSFGISYGSWNTKRIEADYSTPLSKDGRWAGRFVAAYQDGDSYIDLLHDDRSLAYGVIDGQIGDNTTLTFGYTYQKANSDGAMWGGLALANNDGTQAEFPRSSTTAQDWSYWNTEDKSAFVELSHALGANWTLKETYNYRDSDGDEKLFYAWNQEGLDPVTHEGITASPGRYADHAVSHHVDVSLTGHFQAFGREHDVVLGVAQAKSSGHTDTWDVINDVDAGDPDPYAPMPAFPYPGNVIPEPIWGPRYVYEEGDQTLRRIYGAARFAFTDRFKAIVGFNQARYHREGSSSWGEVYSQTESKFSPYAGLTFDITDNILAYASYSDIYQPQDQTDINLHLLDPTKGVNTELGVKATWFDGRLLTSLAAFSAKQQNLATLAGVTEDLTWYYEGRDVESKGVEFEATGKLNDNVDLVFGYTSLQLDGADGNDSYPWVPRHTANLALSAKLSALPALRLGVSGRWQSKTANWDDGGIALIHQQPYAVANVFGEWSFNDKVSLRANIDNITDKKYLTSMYYVGYYGAPRNYTLSLDWKF
ncbi:MAG: TonB-dependent siderophore receptor [Thermomonas sp.]